MGELIVVYLNGHEVWIKPYFEKDYSIYDANVLTGYKNGEPEFEQAPGWLFSLLSNELYDEIMRQIYGEELTLESM